MSLIYLDNAATTRIDDEVLNEMLPYLREHYGNASTQYSIGRTARAAIEESRKIVANWIHASGKEIVFTSGGTEASNLALFNAVMNLGVKKIITSPIEHHCVLHTLEHLKLNHDVELCYLSVDRKGHIDLSQLSAWLETANKEDKHALVSLMHANNEIGTMNDLPAISRIVQDHHALLHSDTVQTMAHFSIDVKVLNIDFITGSAHKFHGPKGVGFLYAKGNHRILPILHGGGQERQKRAGTENVAGIVGMAKALQIGYEKLAASRKYIEQLKSHFIKRLKDEIPNVEFNGEIDFTKSLYTVLNVSLPPCDQGSLLLFQLDMAGICASGGSACSSGAPQPSHVLSAINHDENRIGIRFSFSKYNTIDEIDRVVSVLKKFYIPSSGETH